MERAVALREQVQRVLGFPAQTTLPDYGSENDPRRVAEFLI